MASYTRLGSYMLSSELTADPIGKVHRGLSLTGAAFERHHLIRTFSDELVDAGFAARIADAQRVAAALAGARGFGTNYHIEGGRTPHVICDYIPGRSLDQVLRKTREEQIPLGVDHSLSVIQGLAQSLMALASKDLHHGALSPHSIWVSFEGATQLIDTPFAGILSGLLPKARKLESELAPYRNASITGGLQQDLFALGAILYEMLTLEKLPAQDAIPAALAKATMKAAQEDGMVPPEITSLLRRLLLEPQSFATMGAFNQELERVLYDGDYSPTTFNMAFFMHTLFREESDQDASSMKADQSADYTPFLPSDASSRSMLVAPDGSSRVKLFVGIGAVVVALFASLGYMQLKNSRENEALSKQLAELQQQKSANENKLQDISKQEEAQKILQEQLAKKASEAKTAEERAKIRKEQEDMKAKNEELARQKEEALKKSKELAAASTTIAQKAAPAPAPAPKQEPPPPPPAAAPVQQPAAAVPQPAAPTPQPAAAPSQDIVETPVQLTNRANPMMPRNAKKDLLPISLRDQELRVTLKVYVDTQGHPVKVMIVKGIDSVIGYNDSAQKAALDSGYTPATRNGKPIAAWLTLEYNFGKAR